MKRALITGISGQDGAYLTKFLLSKGYEIHGSVRALNEESKHRLSELKLLEYVKLHAWGDIGAIELTRALNDIAPDEVYNLAGNSLVSLSELYPSKSIFLGALLPSMLLECLYQSNSNVKFYQASSSEMFGTAQTVPQSELTPFCPRNLYGIAKLCAHWATVYYREARGAFACSGILFNHESPLRDPVFVTRKITQGFARIRYGLQNDLELGNLDAIRDWGFAGDYVEGMWRMLQLDRPEDFVLATGLPHTIREFAEIAASALGWDLVWRGVGFSEEGLDRRTGRILVRVNPTFWRQMEPCALVGDAANARNKLDWEPKIEIRELAEMMVTADARRISDRSNHFKS